MGILLIGAVVVAMLIAGQAPELSKSNEGNKAILFAVFLLLLAGACIACKVYAHYAAIV